MVNELQTAGPVFFSLYLTSVDNFLCHRCTCRRLAARELAQRSGIDMSVCVGLRPSALCFHTRMSPWVLSCSSKAIVGAQILSACRQACIACVTASP